MTNPHIAAVAKTLLAARRDRQPADPVQHIDQLQSTDEAYAVQELVRKELAPAQAAVGRHWKSGVSSRMASLLSSARLDSGVWASPAKARDWPFNMRLIEIEIALKINRLVSPAEAATLTHEQAHALIGAMAVTIEVVDSRWQQNEQLQPLLKLADMQTHGALVIGNWMPYSEQEAERDWARQRCTVKIGQAAAQEFVGTHSMQDPRWLLPFWLRDVTAGGASVPAGTVVTTGSWCGMPAAQPGDLVVASFDGVGMTTVQL
jgi:2-keto-4-pentenoate hydratase